jgi:hypothetical protein
MNVLTVTWKGFKTILNHASFIIVVHFNLQLLSLLVFTIDRINIPLFPLSSHYHFKLCVLLWFLTDSLPVYRLATEYQHYSPVSSTSSSWRHACKPQSRDLLSWPIRSLGFLSGGRDSSVGIATMLGLNGLGFEPRWGWDFSCPSIPAPRST